MFKIILLISTIAILTISWIFVNSSTQYKNIKGEKNKMSTIEQSWNKLFNYWKIIKSKPYCKGASEEEINKLKNGLKLKLPQPFIDSLKICNGEKLEINYKIKYSEKIKKNPYQTISLGIIRTFDIDKILEMRYVGDETPEEWIPLAYWSGDYQAILDIRKETFGQVLFGIVEDDRSFFSLGKFI